MRIAMISEHASPLASLGSVDAGGQNLHVAQLSVALARQGHEIRVYTRRDDGELPRQVAAAPGVTVVHVPAGPAYHIAKDELLPYMGAFGHWLAGDWAGGPSGGWTPDVIHAHFWMSGLAALVAAETVPRPIVQTFHALGVVKRRHQREQDTSPPSRIRLECVLGARVDRIVAQCRDEVRELIRLGVRRHRITVVPSGVDTAAFSPLGPVAPRQPDRSRILSVGRLVPRKGFADLIRALRLVPQAEVVIVGGPPAAELDQDPEATRLQAIAHSCGVADRVRLLGAVPQAEMPRWYRSADVLVCSPWYEPFGITALEGMACGNPVVATAVGGLMDTVVDGVTGHLVPPRNPQALGSALRRLLADPLRRLGYATAGVDRARQCYPWTRAARQVAAVYDTVRGRPAGAPIEPVQAVA